MHILSEEFWNKKKEKKKNCKKFSLPNDAIFIRAIERNENFVFIFYTFFFINLFKIFIRLKESIWNKMIISVYNEIDLSVITEKVLLEMTKFSFTLQ